MNFAVGNPVINVIVADSKEIAEMVTGQTCYEYTYENPATIGWILDEETGLFKDPNIPVVVEQSETIESPIEGVSE